MTRPRAPGRILGWLTSGAAALGLVGSAAALALAAERRDNVLILDLGTTPPSAPAIAALSEAAPDVAAADPSLPAPSDLADTLPSVPEATTSPVLHAAAPMSQPKIEPPVPADLSLPPKLANPEADPGPTTKPRPRPEARPDPKPAEEPKAEPRKEPKRTEPHPEELAQNDKATSSASAPGVAAKAKGSAISPAAYARAVMKKVRATKRKSGAGKGTVVVGFTIARDGSLASVQVLQSSGNATLDAVAVDHIRRSAPFPPPASDQRPGYSFEFVGK